MNEDLQYRRVRIRKEILPFLSEYNPKIIENLARTANLIGSDAEILRKAARQILIEEEDFLRTGLLKTLSPIELSGVLREWLRKVRGNLRGLEMSHFEAIEKLLNSRKSGKIIELPGGETVLKSDGKLIFAFRKRKIQRG